MTVDRSNEYLLVVEMRKLANQVSKSISEATKLDYLKKYSRIIQTGKTPEAAKSKKSYYAYRAALLYGISQDAIKALRARDKAEYQSTDWKAAMTVLQRCKAVFDRYPPDPCRSHRLNGSSSFTWSDIDIHKSKSIKDWSPAINSKKRVLAELRNIDNWHSKLFSNITQVHKNAAAICSLTGARPSEIARGVLVRVGGDTDDPNLIITIKGTKLTNSSGQPERYLKIGIANLESRHLFEQCKTGNELLITTHPANFTAAVIKAGKASFPNLNMTVSPYVLRHSISSELKASKINEEPIAKVLGHQATKSQQAYGHKVYASGSHNILAVSAVTPVRSTHRNPDFLRVLSYSPPLSFHP